MSVESTPTDTAVSKPTEAEDASVPVSSRRAFLGGTTAAVAAGGVLAALPHRPVRQVKLALWALELLPFPWRFSQASLAVESMGASGYLGRLAAILRAL